MGWNAAEADKGLKGHHLAAALIVQYKSPAEVKSQWTSIYYTEIIKTPGVHWQSLIAE